MRRAWLVVACGGVLTAACSTTTAFVVENAPADAVLDVGTAPAVTVRDGTMPIEIASGAEPVPWKLRSPKGVIIDEGTIERTEVQWPVVVTGIGLAACCMPGGALAGFCLANPALLAAPVSCLAAGNAGVVVTTLASPSWASGTVTAAGVALGATPLLLGLAAQAPPEQVKITLPIARPLPVTSPVPLPSTSLPAIPAPAGAAEPEPPDDAGHGEPNRMPF